MKTTIIDYGLGNLASIKNALDRLGMQSEISSDPVVVKKSELIILPGVGSASRGMRNLKKKRLDKVIVNEIAAGKPLLGICLGMQLLFDKSEEGNVSCLGLIKGIVRKFKKKKKVPQIGWNGVKLKVKSQKLKVLFNNISNMEYYYFINSYYCIPDDKSIVAGMTSYGEEFPSIIVKNSIIATQFHPEKSGVAGLKLLLNIFNYFNFYNK